MNLFDGDQFRQGLNSDLGFTKADRKENIRRMAELAKLFAAQGGIVITSLISPYAEDRLFAKSIHDDSDLVFLECFVDTPLDECEKRDTKGFYRRARAGQIKCFTGFDSPYEKPETPSLVLKTVGSSIEECAESVIQLLEERKIIPERIKELWATGDELKLLQLSIDPAKSIELTKIDLQWLQVLIEGWATPLKGFMTEEELLHCLYFSGISNGMSNKKLCIDLDFQPISSENNSD